MADLPKIGVDIGSATIKLVELQPQGKDKWRLLSAASMTTPNGGISGGPGNMVVISQSIAKILKEVGIRSRKAVVALPEEQVSSHVVEMPIMSEAEVEQALQWQVEQYIPIPADKAVWSHTTIRKDASSGGMEVLLVASAKTLVNSYIQVLEQAGLDVVAVETELMATARAEVPVNSPLSLVVDIGSGGTDLGIVSQGQLMFSRTIPTGGESFTRAIESGLNLDTATAEQYKNSYGLAESKLKGELSKAMKPVLTVIAGEIRKTVDFYTSKHLGEVVKLAVLSGGVASMPELVKLLSEQVGVEMVIGNPLARVLLDAKQAKAMEGNAPFYGVALGLAMRSI